jgi:protein-arginine deiminase
VTRALTATPDPSDDIGVAWRKAVLNAAKAEGATHGGQELPTSDTWVQDDFEPAYTSIPGPGGTPHGMHVLINSVNDARRVASRDVFTDLVGHDVAAVHTEHAFDPEEDSSLDSMGNLETIPAAPGHPNGRIVLGQDTGLPDSDGPAPEILTMLRSQGQQDPIMLDTSWLDVGHVDEFLQFVPVPSSRRGWKVLVADPDAGVDLLRQVRHAGQGSERLHTGLPPTLPWPYDGIVDQRTVDEYLADAQFVDTNRVAAARIDANVQRLMQAAGITNVDIVRLPVVYTARTFDWLMLKQSIDGMADGPDKDAQIAKLNGLRVATADTANVVNGLDLNGGRYFAPKPFGPLLDGVDVFEQATTAALQRAGLHVTYLDDFLSEHESAGELHCASNTLRDALGTTNTWWAG